MMANLLVLVVMIGAAMVPLALCTYWMKRGKVGYPMTLASLFGACLAIAIYASSNLIGVHPLHAMSSAMLVFLPGTLGSMAGMLLGWLIYRRRQGRPD